MRTAIEYARQIHAERAAKKRAKLILKDSVRETYIAFLSGEEVARTYSLPTYTDMNKLMTAVGRRFSNLYGHNDYRYFWFRTDKAIILAFTSAKHLGHTFDEVIATLSKLGYADSAKSLQKRGGVDRMAAIVAEHWEKRSIKDNHTHRFGGTRLPK